MIFYVLYLLRSQLKSKKHKFLLLIFVLNKLFWWQRLLRSFIFYSTPPTAHLFLQKTVLLALLHDCLLPITSQRGRQCCQWRHPHYFIWLYWICILFQTNNVGKIYIGRIPFNFGEEHLFIHSVILHFNIHNTYMKLNFKCPLTFDRVELPPARLP